MTTKILVIDDDTAVTDLLSVLLRSQGFDVTATNSSSDGLSYVRDSELDLIILDLMMPEIVAGKFAAPCAHSARYQSLCFLRSTTHPWLPACSMLAQTIT